MAQICYLCHKGVLSGHNVSHSKRRTKRRFKPNLHTVRIKTNGVRKVRICSSCLKKIKSTREKARRPSARGGSALG